MSWGLGGDELAGVRVDVVEVVVVVVVVVVGVVRRHLLDAGGDAPHRLHVRLRGRSALCPPPFAPPSSLGGGLGIEGSLWSCTMWWAGGAGWGPGLTVTVVEGSHVPGFVWPAVVVVCGGWMTGRLVTGMRTRAWTGSC